MKTAIFTLVMALVAGLALGCGPRHNKEKKRGVYANPKNAQEAAWRWPGEKIEARDAEGNVAMRLRIRGTRIRAFGHKMASLGDIRRDGDAYVLRDADGVATHRIRPLPEDGEDGKDGKEPEGPKMAEWTVCTLAAPIREGDPEPACADTALRLVGGETVKVLKGEEVLSLTTPNGEGASVEAKSLKYQLEKSGSERYTVTGAAGDAGVISGSGSALVAGPLVTEDIEPILRAGFTVVVEDHHGKWSRKP